MTGAQRPADTAAGGREAVREVIAAFLAEAGIDHELSASGDFVALLPGTAKLRTNVSLSVGESALVVNAFVCRAPDENREAIYRWMLARNPRLYGIAFGLDRSGDIFLVGRVPLAGVTPGELDRLLGSVLAEADGSFNLLVSLGFAGAIAREAAWRADRGLDATNLAGLTGTGLVPGAQEDSAGS